MGTEQSEKLRKEWRTTIMVYAGLLLAVIVGIVVMLIQEGS